MSNQNFRQEGNLSLVFQVEKSIVKLSFKPMSIYV